jgi:hypothetical protein
LYSVVSRNIILTSAVRANSKGLLRPKLCPNCNETNKPESKFCVKCKFVLSFDAYNKTIQDAEYVREQVKGLRESFDIMKSQFYKMLQVGGLSPQEIEELNRLARDIKKP